MWATIVQIGKTITGYVIGSPTILLGCALALSLLVTLSYRSELRDMKQRIAVYDATLNATVEEIKINNLRSANIAAILDDISNMNKANTNKLLDLGTKVDALPTTTACVGSPSIDAVREWLRNNDARPATGRTQ